MTEPADSGTNQKGGASRSFIAFAALVPTLVSAFVAVRTYQLDATLKADRARQELDLKIYDAVKASLNGSAQEQQVALALVISLGHEPLKSQLIRTFRLSSTTDPDVTAEANEYRAAPTEADTHAPASSAHGVWANWDFDLFYCATSPHSAQEQATALQSALLADGAQGRVRVRPLSAEVNARPGYRINGYAIRRGDDEVTIAEALKARGDPLLAGAGPFRLEASGQDTRWYISAFFCPASGAAGG